MQKIISLLCSLVFFLMVWLLAPQPVNTLGKAFFVENPLFLRMLLGPFHTLAADRYWLQSANIDPLARSAHNDKQQSTMYDSANIILTLDPLFKLNLRYSTTYLASIKKHVDKAHALCDTALRFYPTYSYPYLLKISNELGYRHPYRYDRIIDWVKLAKTTTNDSPDWLNDVLLMARKNNDQSGLILSDLQWLLEMAKSPQERELIQSKIDKQLKKGNKAEQL